VQPDATVTTGTLETYTVLSLGNYLSGMFGTKQSKILVRNEYLEMLKLITDLFDCPFRSKGIVVTGQPGIGKYPIWVDIEQYIDTVFTVGKTVFLHYVLIDRILNGLVTAYQIDSKRAFLFLGPNHVRKISADEILDPEVYDRAWALVDSNANLDSPREEFVNMFSKFFVVNTSSPQPQRWKSWKKYQSASLTVMRPWSWKEMYIGG
jgi:hypothetical protein